MAAQSEVLELAERMWNDEGSSSATIQVRAKSGQSMTTNTLHDFGNGLAFLCTFANVTVVNTSEGLVMIDTGGYGFQRLIYSLVREWSPMHVNTAIYTHGHIDHVSGLYFFDEEARENSIKVARVIAHANLPARFDRYKLTKGYNEAINKRQFRVEIEWPTDFRYPDVLYQDEMELEVGDVKFYLYHSKGETDDATWVWIPSHKVICSGDLFVWVAPNCGNPQKAQRYPRHWAITLRKMLELDADMLLPGHGPPIIGKLRVRQALSDTAEYLESIVDQTLALMNQDAPLDKVLHSVKPPAHLVNKPYLRPAYDEPEFIVRNLWRLYGGWWDGNPANLKPAPEAALSAEICKLAKGPIQVARAAQELASQEKFDLACHLIEFAYKAEPNNTEILSIRSSIYKSRQKRERGLMAASIFRAVSKDSAQQGSNLTSKL